MADFWCDEVNFEENVCASGSDAALLEVARVPEGFTPFEIGFAAATPENFYGHVTGYASRAVGPVPTANLLFTTVDVSSNAEYRHLFKKNSTLFYQTGGESFPGYSGGPITFLSNKRYEVVGVLSWRPPGFDDRDAAGPSFGITIGALRTIWSSLPRSGRIDELAKRVAGRQLSSDSLAATLSRWPNGEVVSFVDALRSIDRGGGQPRPIGASYWAVVYDEATVRDLDEEKLYLESHVRVESIPAWLRDAAKSRRRLAESLLIHQAVSQEDRNVAKQYLAEAVVLNKKFLRAAKESRASWYGRGVFGDVVGELNVIYNRLGETGTATIWNAAGASLGDAEATVRLANTTYNRREFSTAAELYAMASDQRRQAGLHIPTYVRSGYSDSVEALVLAGSADAKRFPRRMEEISAEVTNATLSSIAWLGDRWQGIVDEFAPRSLQQ